MNETKSSPRSFAAAPVASFDKAAAGYHEHAHVQRALAAWLAEWLPAERTGRAIEIGAGPGVFSRHLLPWHGPLVATDLSSAMCAAGRAALPDIVWRTMAAETPDGGPWDWIFSSSMLQWAAHPDQMFATWHRQLADRGRVLAGLFVQPSLPELPALLENPPPLRWRTVEDWRTHLARGGLRLLRDETQGRVFEYPSALALWRSLHGVGAAPGPRVSAARLRRLMRDYEARYRHPRGGVSAQWTFYRFEAVAG